MWYLKSENSLQWITCSLNILEHVLQTTEQTSSIWNMGIIRGYIRIIWYSTGDLCWHNKSKGIAKRKYWACATCKQPKTTFCLVIISNFTSMSWTFLLKKALAKICYALGGEMSLLVKLLKSKSGITTLRPFKVLRNNTPYNISHCLLTYNLITSNIGP